MPESFKTTQTLMKQYLLVAKWTQQRDQFHRQRPSLMWTSLARNVLLQENEQMKQ
jgi:hypothetical protein